MGDALAADALSSAIYGAYGSGGSGSGSQQPNAQMALEDSRADLGAKGTGAQSDTSYDAEMARLHQMADSELGSSRVQPTSTSNVGLASNNDRSFIDSPTLDSYNANGGEHWSSGVDTYPVADNKRRSSRSRNEVIQSPRWPAGSAFRNTAYMSG